jgi:exonuclease III
MRSLVALEGRLPLARRFSVRHHGREAMLDHILVSHPLLAHCRHVEVHNETLGDEWLERAALRHSAGSFHAPVLADFALPVLPEAPS